MPATNVYEKHVFYLKNAEKHFMPKPITDTTFNHHPHEYEVISCNEDVYGSEKIIYIGTFEQCEERMNEIANFDCDYVCKCQVRKV